MTESEWLASDDPQAMMRAMQGFHEPVSRTYTGWWSCVTDRKLRLFACAWRRVAAYCKESEVEEWEQAGYNDHHRFHTDLAWAESWAGDDGRVISKQVRAAVLRDIFGNPWKPVQRATFWAENDTVQSLASSAYDFQDWSLLPIIADKLEDIGCCEWEFLDHLRGKQLTHCRGCWAIDLLLGKS